MKKRSSLFCALALATCLNLTPASQAMTALPTNVKGHSLPSLGPMLEKVLPAVVSVYVEGTQAQTQNLPEPLQRFFGGEGLEDNQPQPFEGMGSGVIIDATKGYVLTTSDVTNNAEKIKILLSDGNEYNARLIGYDEGTDIALLQLNDAKNLTQIKIADSDQLKVGDFAVAIGNPFGLGQTATSGIISALGRSGLTLEGLENFIQTDAAINRGNYGGALVNLKGELTGINTAILASSGGNIGIGFAIPSNMAITLAQQLIESGKVQRGHLGIKGTEMTAEMGKAFHHDDVQRGAFIIEVIPHSAAAAAGIKAGDIIVSFNGKSITSFAELRVKVTILSPGTEINLGLLREGKPVSVSVRLENDSQSTTNAVKLSPFLRGATLRDGQLKNGPKGITVDTVSASSPAEQLGLLKEDIITGVNRTPVHTVADLQKILETHPPLVALSIVRAGEPLYLLLR